MMTRRLSLRLFAIPALIVMLAGLSWSTPSWAIDLQTAKSQGLVGETPTGYLGLVKSGSADAKAMMNEINTARKKAYKDVAKRNNTELNAVEALAGKKAIERTPSGQYVQSPSGQWIKK